MAKNVFYRCQNCNEESRIFYDRCPKCHKIGTLVEVSNVDIKEKSSQAGFKSDKAIVPNKAAMTISQLKQNPIKRTRTDIKELDRVLGGGLVEAEVVLFAGEPGAGKSTLSLSIANQMAKLGQKVLYSSGEESEQQIGLRAARMNISNDNIKIVNETNLETVLGYIDQEEPNLVIIDSLQTIASTGVNGSLGSVSQSREAAQKLTTIAKKRNISMFLISQIVKSGEFSGSEAIQHVVDCGLMFESSKDSPLKFLRATKNRFGDTTEVGIFQHTEHGLEEVPDPSGVLIDTDIIAEGAACTFISEGTRQIPVEVQALVTNTTYSNSMKRFSGVSNDRGQIICAIIDRFCNGGLWEKDVFVSTVAGLRIFDPQADMAVAVAILSSINQKTLKKRTAFVGELGLTGQVRGSFMIENKVREALRLGFDQIVIPKSANYRIEKSLKDHVHFVDKASELKNFFN